MRLENPLVGVSIMPEYYQVEGPRCIDNLIETAGATAIVTSPCVARPSENGTREPTAVGAFLDRPLWGQHSLKMKISPSFFPNLELYRGLRYQPPAADDLTREHGHVVSDLIAHAKADGINVHMRLQAAAPPGFRPQFGGPLPGDEPRLPDGSIDDERLDRNASLASIDIQDYMRALITDLCQQYPEIDGFHVDWAEYPPYTINTTFFDFSEHAKRVAGRHGLDFDEIKHDAITMRETLLGGLSDEDLRQFTTTDGGRLFIAEFLLENPGATNGIRLKRLIVEEMMDVIRQAIDSVGDRRRELMPMAFPPPWSMLSGFNYSRAPNYADSIGLKLIPSHWPMILRSYGDTLLGSNPILNETLLVKALLSFLDIQDKPQSLSLSDFSHPERGKAFRPGNGPELRKINFAQYSSGKVPVTPLLHGLGPIDDFRVRLQANFQAASGRIWINRYGFLSDDKLVAIGELSSHLASTTG